MKLLNKLLIPALAIAMIIPAYASPISSNLSTLETKGSVEFKVANAGKLTSKQIAETVLRSYSTSNKSSLVIDNQLKMTLRTINGAYYLKASLPSPNYYDEVDKLISDKLSDSRAKTDIEKVVDAHSFVVNLLSYNADYETLREGMQYKQGDCKVYTALYARSLEYLGVQHRAVYSTINATKVPHVHSQVKVANKWYHVDTTENDQVNEAYSIFLTDTKTALTGRTLNNNIMKRLVPQLNPSLQSFLGRKYSAVYKHYTDDLLILIDTQGGAYYTSGTLASIRSLGVSSRGGALLGDYLYTNVNGKLTLLNVFTGEAITVGSTPFTSFTIKKDAVFGYKGTQQKDVTTYTTYEQITSYKINTIGGNY